MPDDPLEQVAGLAQPIRRALYRLVAAEHAGVSAQRAAEATGLPRSSTSYHLDKLVEHGLLRVRFERLTGRQGPGAGRPAKIYEPAARAIEISVPPRDYQSVSLLMAAAIEHVPAAWLQPLLQSADEHGRQLWSQHASGDATESAWPAVTAVLRERGYEPSRAGQALTLQNCPFDAVARAHREVICAMNLAILRGLLHEAGVTDRTAVLSVDSRRCCVLITPIPDERTTHDRDIDRWGE